MFVYFNLLNSNESLSYTQIKVIIHYLIKIIYKEQIIIIIIKFNIDLISFELQLCWMVIKKY